MQMFALCIQVLGIPCLEYDIRLPDRSKQIVDTWKEDFFATGR